MTEEIIVSICCLTYNHEKFIRDALDGFMMQKTDFPIEILVHDDASTDGTPAILREYQEKRPDLFRIVNQTENRFSKGLKNSPLLFQMARGKYIALCEGDDYWTDPLKLQKQVDLMESHPECSICCHNVLIKYESSEKDDYCFPNIDGDKILNKSYLYENAFIRTCSVFFRNVDIDGLLKFTNGFKVGDTPLYFYYAQKGDIGFIEDCMGVYRIHQSGIWSTKNEIDKYLGFLETRFMLQKILKIHYSGEFSRMTIKYILKVIDYSYEHNDRQTMKKYLFKGYRYILAANEDQVKKFLKYSFMFLLPQKIVDQLKW